MSTELSADRRPTAACLLVAIALFAFLLIRVGTLREPLAYDEPWYIEDVRLIHQHGLGTQFLTSLKGPAGPLYQVVHWIAEPLTHLTVPGVRLVNLILLPGWIFFTVLLLREVHVPNSVAVAAAAMGIPTLWLSSGMALTETPAIFFVTASLWMLAVAFRHRDTHRGILLALPAGLCFGVAILGRQPYLVCLCAGVAFCRDRRSITVAAAFAVACLGMVAPVFWTWRGLSPPATAVVGQGVKLAHLWQSWFYAGCYIAVLAPRFFSVHRWTILTVAAGTLAVTPLMIASGYAPSFASAESRLTGVARDIYRIAVPAALAAVCIWVVASYALRVWERRNNPMYLAIAIANAALLVTPIKVTHVFSARYIFCAAPMLILLSADFGKPSYWKAARILVGGLVGYWLMMPYFSVHF